MPQKIKYDIGRVIGEHEIVFNGSDFLAKGHRFAEFICRCGKKFVNRIDHIKFGKVRSCGCIWKDSIIKAVMTHGESSTPLYQCHTAMKARCKNANNPNFFRYGTRGITVCDEWEKYEKFAEWAKSAGYKKGLTLDRNDNNGGYNPENCRWVSQSENCENTRMSCLWVTPDGVFASLRKACEFYGKNINTRFRNKHEGYIKRKKYENN